MSLNLIVMAPSMAMSQRHLEVSVMESQSIVPSAVVADLMAIGLTFGAVAPASPASVNLRYKRCTTGGVATEARANYNVLRSAFAGGHSYEQHFPSGSSAMRWTTMYTGAPIIDTASVSNGDMISSARIFCDY